jgi:arylsulfatase A-like enzyme
VFAFADQLRAQTVSCYGNEQVPMPNVDRLAAEGAVMENAVSTYPVCSPYRGMLLTGQYPMHNGTVGNDTGLRDDLPTVATACRDAGYRTGYVGKWHLEWDREPYVGPERRQGFEEWAVRNCAHDYTDSFYYDGDGERHELPGYEPVAQTDRALDFVAEHRDGPFCLFLSWGTPHDPYDDVPDRYTEQFPADEIDLRANVDERAVVDELLATDPSDCSGAQAERREHLRSVIEDDDRLRREWLQGYYAHTRALDDCLGRLLDGLDAHGLREDTIVVFASDHGDMLGSHRMGSKQMPHEESIRVPFVARYPERIPAGHRSDALFEPVDVMPTLLDLAGLDVPPVDGRSFADALTGASGEHREALLLMKLLPGGNPWMANGVTPWRGVRTERYTYARLLDRGPWLLYDNDADPRQRENHVDDPAYADVRERLEARLDDLLAAADDPADTEAIAEYRASRRPAE